MDDILIGCRGIENEKIVSFPDLFKKGKGMFLYSAVSSPSDRSKRCTLFALPGRPVHSDT